jgi:hypothetical protein
MNDIVTKIIITLASTTTLTLLSWLIYRFRNLILYKEAQYRFDVEDGTDPVIWDIQMEGQERITIGVNHISNDLLEDVGIRLNKLGRIHEIKGFEVSNDFIPLFDGRIQIQLSSIVRTCFSKANKPCIYTVQFILRRRRRLL